MMNVNQITTVLRGMSDQQLQQYAAMHKSDPFVFPLAFQESQARQQLRAGQALQMAGQKAPPVVDQDLARMTPTPITGGYGQAINALPEEQGIGALPAQNLAHMADGGIAGYAQVGNDGAAAPNPASGPAGQLAFNNEPVMRMSGGGIAHFAEGSKEAIKGDYSPDFMRAFYKTLGFEGGSTTDTGGKTKYGISQKAYPDLDIANLTKADAARIYKRDYWDKIHGDRLAKVNPDLADVMLDTAVNHGTTFANNALARSNGNPFDILNKRKEHYQSLVENNPKKYSAYEQGWNNRLTNLAAGLTGSGNAQAENLSIARDTSTAGMIPGQNVKAPAYVPEKKGFFGNLADQMGLSEETQRNISNLSNAAAGATGATYIPSYLPKAGLGIASLGERLYNRFNPQAGVISEKGIAELQAANKAAQLEQGVKGAQEAGATLEEQDFIRKMMEANQKAQAPSKALEVQNAANLREAIDTARLTEGANAANAANKAIAASNIPRVATSALTPSVNEEATQENVAPPALEGAKTNSSVSDIANTVTQTAGGKGGRDWNDFLLNMGLGLMAGKSPYAFQNLGEAGIGALRHEQEAKKQALEERKIASEEAYQAAMAKHWGVDPLIQRLQALQDPKTMAMYKAMKESEREPMTREKLLTAYMSTLPGQMGKLENFPAFVQQYEEQFGPLGGVPQGVKVTQRGG